MADKRKRGDSDSAADSDGAGGNPDDTRAEDAWFAGESTPPPPPSEPPSPPHPPAHEPTIFLGGADESWGGPPPPVPPAPEIPPGPAADEGHLRPGVLLNHIYEVRRFIARGGMGEVYEGINVATDERVAIKVILQTLMGDPNVHELFRKEARTLTRLNHPALVQYRLLAQEPQLGVFYIVTEFVDGVSLSDVLGELRPFLDDLKLLARRLAEGLRAAHALGAIHRDVSPDNILLQRGRVSEAKIIDFGISKDLEAPGLTIVSGGFAGKLGYVAPEQFGDFGGEVGPWTDVYSLGLVLLAVAAGRAPEMGRTMSEAIDIRRQGPDVSAMPQVLQPLLRRMLAADPAQRIRSMDEVLQGLDGVLAPDSPPPPPDGPPSAPPPPRTWWPPRPWMILAAAGVAAVVVVGGIVGLAGGGSRPSPASPAAPPSPVPAQAGPQAPPDDLASLAANLPCAWVEPQTSGSPGLERVVLTGAAGSPERAAQAMRDALIARGVADPNIDNRLIALQPAACAVVETLRRYRAPPSPADPWIRLPSDFALTRQPQTCNRQQTYARIDLTLKPGRPPDDDLALVGMDASGNLQSLFVGMAEISKPVYAPHVQITPQAVTIDSCDFDAGDKAFVVIRGAGLSSAGLDQDAPKPADPDFARRFAALADANHWRVQMSWYRVAPAE